MLTTQEICARITEAFLPLACVVQTDDGEARLGFRVLDTDRNKGVVRLKPCSIRTLQNERHLDSIIEQVRKRVWYRGYNLYPFRKPKASSFRPAQWLAQWA